MSRSLPRAVAHERARALGFTSNTERVAAKRAGFVSPERYREALAAGDAAPMPTPPTRTYPFAPLSRWTIEHMHAVSGVSRHTLHRAQERGLSTYQADRIAQALGLHPCSIWLDWLAGEADER